MEQDQADRLANRMRRDAELLERAADQAIADEVFGAQEIAVRMRARAEGLKDWADRIERRDW